MVNQGATPQRGLEVNVMFKPCRIATLELARAYDRLLPIGRRKLGRANQSAKIDKPVDEIRGRQGGGR